MAEKDARRAGDVGTKRSERNSSSFSFCIELPYLRLHCSRLPDDCDQVQSHLGVRERRSSQHKIAKGTPYGVTNIGEGRSWLERQRRTQRVQGDKDSRTEPESSFLYFVFMTPHSHTYRSKVYGEVDVQSLIFKGKEDDAELQAECEDPMMKDDSCYIAKTRLDYGNISRLASNEVMIGPRGAESVEVSGVLRATALEENYEAKVPFSVLIRTLSTAKYRYPSAKEEAIDSDGQLEA
ncbi:hypothetical protein M404DRAFT_29293, partial [Pisolithus tinctorius Marx 270]